MKFLHVIEVKYVGGHRIWIRLDNGSEGEIELAGDLDGPVFQPLKDPTLFEQARIEGGTVAWPNGADLAPEYLRDRLVQPPGRGNE